MYPEKYYLFFEAFNKGEYYECHDLLEDIWMEQRSNKFLQGLLQMAVAIHHFENGNVKGSRTLFESAYQYLQLYRPCHWDLDLERVLAYIEACLQTLPNRHQISQEEVKQISFPRLHLQLSEKG